MMQNDQVNFDWAKVWSLKPGDLVFFGSFDFAEKVSYMNEYIPHYGTIVEVMMDSRPSPDEILIVNIKYIPHLGDKGEVITRRISCVAEVQKIRCVQNK